MNADKKSVRGNSRTLVGAASAAHATLDDRAAEAAPTSSETVSEKNGASTESTSTKLSLHQSLLYLHLRF
jgi:hypothetical protein